MTTTPQAKFDALTKLASYICHSPVALVALMGEGGQLFITRFGPEANETSLEVSFCRKVPITGAIHVIDDTTSSPLYKNHPAVTASPAIRFFAGVPLTDTEGNNIGSLFVLDKVAKKITEDQKDALLAVAAEIVEKFELHKKSIRYSKADQELIDYKYAIDKSCMVSVFGTDGIITYVNDKFCEVSNYAPHEVLGKDHRIFNPDLHSKEFIRDLWNRILKGEIFQIEIKNKAKDGNFFWVASTIIPFFDKNRKPYKYLSISYDVTQKKSQEQQLIEVKVLAEKLSKSKDTFLTNMSHEIRTPLNAITGLGKLLSKSTLDAQQRNYLNGIESASENLLSVINDLLDISKIEAGKITLELISFNFEMLCQQAISILSHKAEEKGLVFAYTIDSKIAPVLIGDPFRINQVFMNMLGNAIKFTEHGHVHLDATLLEQNDTWQKIQINIEDTGVGINPEYLNSIFDKFTQEDETVVRKFGGTGLGMSITKELMELMDGSISVSSQKDKGTTITLIFNFKIGTARVLEKKRTIKNDTSNISNKRILLVEDNNLNRLLAKTILTDYGAIITEAENGQIAVDFMRKDRFDIVLMDVQMPVMDGIQATKIIRKEINATIPIIALTANAIKGKSDLFQESGMNDFISKPYDEIKLVNPIAKWLKQNAPENEQEVTTEKPRVATTTTIIIDDQLPDEEPEIIMIAKAEAPEAVAADDIVALTPPLYDLSKLLEMSGNNDDFIIKMLNLFINEIPPSIRKIKEGYETGDLASVKYYGHMLKPSIFNLEIKDVKKEIVLIEASAEKGIKTPELGEMIKKLDKVIAIVIDQMTRDYNL